MFTNLYFCEQVWNFRGWRSFKVAEVHFSCGPVWTSLSNIPLKKVNIYTTQPEEPTVGKKLVNLATSYCLKAAEYSEYLFQKKHLFKHFVSYQVVAYFNMNTR